MRKQFSDGGYIEFNNSLVPGHIIISIGAKDPENPNKQIINSADITEEDFKQLLDGANIG